MSEAHDISTSPFPVDVTETDDAPKHPNLPTAACAVMAEVKRLEKDQPNDFASYMFTSIDDYKDALRPIMAKHGVSICVSQTGFETFTSKTGQKETLNCVYRFKLWLEHVSGDKGDREGLTVPLPYTGPQTAGIARSYAVKEYLKSRFLQSSGDLAEDADAMAVEMTFSKAQARDVQERMTNELRDIADSGTKEDLTLWSERNKVLLEALPDDWKIHLRHEYQQATLGIELREKGDKATADLPDMEKWKADFASELAAATDIDSVNEVWVQHEGTIDTLIATDKAEAIRMHKERLEEVA